jgi:hypothetical protein
MRLAMLEAQDALTVIGGLPLIADTRVWGQ